jgi:hypothetical protein
MNPLSIINKNGKYGILEGENLVVPCTHETKEDAIKEWEYFETLNTNAQDHRKFLVETKTIEQINEVVKELMSQSELHTS